MAALNIKSRRRIKLLALNKKEVEAILDYLKREQPEKAVEFELIINTDGKSRLDMSVLTSNSSLNCLESIASGLHESAHPNLANKLRAVKVKRVPFNPDKIYLVKGTELVSINKLGLPHKFSVLYVSNSSGSDGKSYAVYLGSTDESIHHATVLIGNSRVYFNPQPRLYSSIDDAANASFSFVTKGDYSVLAIAKNIGSFHQKELVGKIRRENNLLPPKTEKPYALGKCSIAFFLDAPGEIVNYEISSLNGSYRIGGNGIEAYVEDIEGIGERAKLIFESEKGERPIHFSISSSFYKMDVAMIKGAVALAFQSFS